MTADITDVPFRVRLVGRGGTVAGERYAEMGFALMNELWAIVRGGKVANRGVNHWVYLPDHRLFAGVELVDPTAVPDGLEPLTVELARHVRYVHVGAWSDLPRVWAGLKTWIAEQGERIGSPALEIYGHHSDDPAKQETTILIALEPKAVA